MNEVDELGGIANEEDGGVYTRENVVVCDGWINNYALFITMSRFPLRVRNLGKGEYRRHT